MNDFEQHFVINLTCSNLTPMSYVDIWCDAECAYWYWYMRHIIKFVTSSHTQFLILLFHFIHAFVIYIASKNESTLICSTFVWHYKSHPLHTVMSTSYRAILLEFTIFSFLWSRNVKRWIAFNNNVQVNQLVYVYYMRIACVVYSSNQNLFSHEVYLPNKSWDEVGLLICNTSSLSLTISNKPILTNAWICRIHIESALAARITLPCPRTSATAGTFRVTC